jgi:hypothetical protein
LVASAYVVVVAPWLTDTAKRWFTYQEGGDGMQPYSDPAESGLDLMAQVTILDDRILAAYLHDVGPLRQSSPQSFGITREALKRAPDLVTAAAAAAIPVYGLALLVGELMSRGYDRARAIQIASKRQDVPTWLADLAESRRDLNDLIDRLDDAFDAHQTPALSIQEVNEVIAAVSRTRRRIAEAANAYLTSHDEAGPELLGSRTVPIASVPSEPILLEAIFGGKTPEEQLAGYETGPHESAHGYVKAFELTDRTIHSSRHCAALGDTEIVAINRATYVGRKKAGWADCPTCESYRKPI